MRVTVRQGELEAPAERPRFTRLCGKVPFAHCQQRGALELAARHGRGDLGTRYGPVGRHLEGHLDIPLEAVDTGLVGVDRRRLATVAGRPRSVTQTRRDGVRQGEAQARAQRALGGNTAGECGPVAPVAHGFERRGFEEPRGLGAEDPGPADPAVPQHHERDVDEALGTRLAGRLGVDGRLVGAGRRREHPRAVAGGPGQGLRRRGQGRQRQDRGQQCPGALLTIRLVVMG